MTRLRWLLGIPILAVAAVPALGALFDPTTKWPFHISVPYAAMVQTPVTGTVDIGMQFKTLFAFDAARKSCLVPNTTQHPMYIYALPLGGSINDATAANSQRVMPSGSFRCLADGVVITNEIEITTTFATDTYLGWYSR